MRSFRAFTRRKRPSPGCLFQSVGQPPGWERVPTAASITLQNLFYSRVRNSKGERRSGGGCAGRTRQVRAGAGAGWHRGEQTKAGGTTWLKFKRSAPGSVRAALASGAGWERGRCRGQPGGGGSPHAPGARGGRRRRGGGCLAMGAGEERDKRAEGGARRPPPLAWS